MHVALHKAVSRTLIKRALCTLMLAAGASGGTVWAATAATGTTENAPASTASNAGSGSTLNAVPGGSSNAGADGSAAAGSASFSVDTLMHAFAQRKSGDARFTELKYLSNLKGPIESSGTLAFRAPDHFEQQTLKPRAQSVVVDGDTVTMSRDNRQRVVSLSQYPEIAMLVNSIRGTLTGDRTSLERVYKLTLAGTPDAWHLTLTPADPALAKSVDHIVVSGGEGSDHVAQIHTIETFQADGDRSVMTIEAAAP
jgi:outer membrane lipoprotein-sorting protein